MYELIYTGQFKKSLKKCAKRGLNIQNLIEVLDDDQLRLILIDTGTHSDLF